MATTSTTLNQNTQPVINTNNTTTPTDGAPPRIMSTMFGALNGSSRGSMPPHKKSSSQVSAVHMAFKF
jgi:hypothetical protein